MVRISKFQDFFKFTNVIIFLIFQFWQKFDNFPLGVPPFTKNDFEKFKNNLEKFTKKILKNLQKNYLKKLSHYYTYGNFSNIFEH